MANYKKISVAEAPRTELHDSLGLTGAEISINELPAGASVPFVHAHNTTRRSMPYSPERGKAVIDGDTVELNAGDWVRISPAAKRQFFASADEESAICASKSGRTL